MTLTCRKRLDKASPRLLTALAQQASLEVVARYYRLNPTGDGTIEQYYTLTAHNGRITAIQQLTPDALQAPSAPDLEEVTFEFASMSHAYISGGVEGAFP